MKKPEYEAPEFAFQELQLIERVADRCWGAKYIWFDKDKDGNLDIDEPNFSGNGCGTVDDQIKAFFSANPNLDPSFDVNKNHRNSDYKGIEIRGS
ncbi:MAG: hypothetical protein ACI3XM_04770 [Eubacteriales bacterium]